MVASCGGRVKNTHCGRTLRRATLKPFLVTARSPTSWRGRFVASYRFRTRLDRFLRPAERVRRLPYLAFPRALLRRHFDLAHFRRRRRGRHHGRLALLGETLLERFHDVDHRREVLRRSLHHFAAFDFVLDHLLQVVAVGIVVFLRLEILFQR